MIALLIGYPIGSYRAYPNRPRIAQYESCRVVPKNVKVHPSVTHRGTR